MTAAEAQARAAVVEAGKRLLGRGLVERTWGNVSARVSETHFVITPSGMAYETLRPEDLVLVDLRDRSWQGSRKPSSETGIHADAYRLRPEVGFVIHTHQPQASLCSTAGRGFSAEHPSLGGFVPCTAYGLPSTQTLRRAVKAQVLAHPDSPGFLLKSHGALCLGRDAAEAFAVSEALEQVCEARVSAALPPLATPPLPDLGISRRSGPMFTLTRHGQDRIYRVSDLGLRGPAAIHAAIYRMTSAQAVFHSAAPETAAASWRRGPFRPMLDDLAQIAGAEIVTAEPKPTPIACGLVACDAVMVRGLGALCTGATLEEARVVASLLEKGARAWRYGTVTPGCGPLDRRDAWLMRLIYVTQYAKRRGKPDEKAH